MATTRKASPSKKQELVREKLEVLVLRSDGQGQVSLKALMVELANRGIVSVLLEGGPTLSASALREGVVDRLLFFFAPKIVGGRRSPGVIGGEGVLRVREAKPVKIIKVKRMGPDLMVEGALEA